MFFFTGYSVSTLIGFLALLLALIGLNELSRRNKYLGLLFYVLVPLVFTLFVWPLTTKASGGNTGGTWFAWVKTYSALAGVIGFMLLRYVKRWQSNKFLLTFPMLILGINIIEAVIADLECYSMHGVVRAGLQMEGGPWNLLNAAAGILLCLTMTGWLGIKINQKPSQDMIWADQLWFWIIAYDLWNLSYCYNCISNRSFYSGFTLLLACTIAGFCLQKGAWLQHRAQTLALFAMFSLTFDYSANSQFFGIVSTQAAAPKTVLALLSLIANAAVLVWQIYVMKKNKKRNVARDVYDSLAAYQAVLKANEV